MKLVGCEAEKIFFWGVYLGLWPTSTTPQQLVCPFGSPPPQVPKAGDNISRGWRHLKPLPLHWGDGGDSCHGVLCPQPHQGRPTGATHVEDGEEHQDGDLEHADLDGDAVPDLDAGRTEGLKGLSTRSLAAPGSSALG